jgi:hypothetical protein
MNQNNRQLKMPANCLAATLQNAVFLSIPTSLRSFTLYNYDDRAYLNKGLNATLQVSSILIGWMLFFPIFEFQVFNSYKFVCIIGNKDEIARDCLSCDEHVVRTDKISFFF